MAAVTKICDAKNMTGVWFHVQWIGSVLIYRMSPGYDHGAFDARPWHVCTFGANFPTLEAAVDYLRSIKPPTDDGAQYNPRSECESSYLSCY